MEAIKLSLLFCVLALTTQNCVNEATAKYTGTTSLKSSTLIFIDKTLSVNFDKKHQEDYAKAMWEFNKEHYNDIGDRVVIHYVHENTLGAQRVADMTCSIVPLGDISHLGKRDRDNKTNAYRVACRQSANDCIDTFIKSFENNSFSTVKNETDLWATFEVMSRFFTKDSDTGNKHVFYFSDMVESVKKGNRKEYDKERFKSKSEAETAAHTDAKLIREKYIINDEALKEISVSVVFPNSSFSKDDKEYYLYYWEALFKIFGITNVREGM